MKTTCKGSTVGFLVSAKDLLRIYGHKLKSKTNQHNVMFFSIHVSKVDRELNLTSVGALPGKSGSSGHGG